MKSIKTLFSVIIITLLFFGITSCKDDSDKTTYVIAMEKNFEPFCYIDNSGNITGFEYELLSAISKDQDLSYQLSLDTWENCINKLKNNEVDGILSQVSITEERKTEFDFSDEITTTSLSLAVNNNNEEITSFDNLSGKIVAVQEGTIANDYAESIKVQYGFTVKTFSSINETYNSITDGSSDAIIDDGIMLNYMVAVKKMALKVIVKTIENTNLSTGFAVKKGSNAELIQKINAGLAKIKTNGTYQTIYDKYFSNSK